VKGKHTHIIPRNARANDYLQFEAQNAHTVLFKTVAYLEGVDGVRGINLNPVPSPKRNSEYALDSKNHQ